MGFAVLLAFLDFPDLPLVDLPLGDLDDFPLDDLPDLPLDDLPDDLPLDFPDFPVFLFGVLAPLFPVFPLFLLGFLPLVFFVDFFFGEDFLGLEEVDFLDFLEGEEDLLDFLEDLEDFGNKDFLDPLLASVPINTVANSTTTKNTDKTVFTLMLVFNFFFSDLSTIKTKHAFFNKPDQPTKCSMRFVITSWKRIIHPSVFHKLMMRDAYSNRTSHASERIPREICLLMEVPSSIRRTWLAKYGVDNPMKEFRMKQLQHCKAVLEFDKEEWMVYFCW